MNLIITLLLLLTPALAIRASSQTSFIPYIVSNEFTCNLAYTNNHWNLDTGFSCPFQERQASEYQDPWTDTAYQTCTLQGILGGKSSKTFSFTLTYGTRVEINGFNPASKSLSFKQYHQCSECNYKLYDDQGMHIGGEQLYDEDYNWEDRQLKSYQSSQKASKITFWCNNPAKGLLTREDDYQIESGWVLECRVPQEGWLIGCNNYEALLRKSNPDFLIYQYQVTRATTPYRRESNSLQAPFCELNLIYDWGSIRLNGGWGERFTLKDIQKYHKINYFEWLTYYCDRCYLNIYNSSGGLIEKTPMKSYQQRRSVTTTDNADIIVFFCSDPF